MSHFRVSIQSCQSIGEGDWSFDSNGCRMTGGSSVRKSSSFELILLRMVRAAYSSLSEACQHGTMLCASTWANGMSGGRLFFSSSIQLRPIRSGEKSQITPPILFSFTNNAICSGGLPISKKNGIFNSFSSCLKSSRVWKVREHFKISNKKKRKEKTFSTSLRPSIMKWKCRKGALRNVGTRQKHTCNGKFCLRASFCAYNSAQLSKWTNLEIINEF